MELRVFFCALLCAGSVHAEQISVRTSWGDVKRGELVEGVRGDYLLLRYPSQREETIRWESIHSVARAGYPYESKKKLALPYAARPSIGVQFGLGAIGAERFGPYLGSGVTLGVSGGVSLARWAALIAVYEWTSHPYDERNTGAPAGRSHFVGLAARLRTNDGTGGVGFFFQPAVGLRQTAYSFSALDGDGMPPTGRKGERASLLGWELRAAAGLAFTASRTVSVDLALVPGIGSFFDYSDTLGCATFRYGACGGGYRFTYTSFALMIGIAWN